MIQSSETKDKPDGSLSSKYEGPEGVVNRWLKEIAIVQENRKQKAFEKHGERIMKKYINALDVDTFSESGLTKTGRVMFNVLWSNVQVLEPALYSRMPKVVAQRISKDSDPVGRLAAEIAEDATQYNLNMQQDQFNYVMSQCVQDRLLPGRGQVWLEYKAEFEEATDENGEIIVDEAGAPIKAPKPNSEKVTARHVYYTDYLESLSRSQYDMRWRAVRIYLNRSQCISEFGEEIGKAIKLGGGVQNRKGKDNDDAEFLKQAEVWVIYEWSSKQVLWISEGYMQGPLKQLKDPYKLKDFWCCPIPLCATTTTDSTYPTADYIIYEGLADELNYVTKRLKAIVDCVRLVGVASSTFMAKLKNITSLADGALWPVDNWVGFAEKGGIKGLIDWLPFEQCVSAIPVLTEYQANLKAQIDEITSMPDIVRGSSDPNDPVYTQQQKSHWTVIKLTKKQQDVQRFVREIVSKMAELIFEPGLFSDETIALMSGIGLKSPEKQQMFGEALQLLRDDRMRTFRVSIETDSTIAIDEEESMARWMNYLSAIKDIVGEVQNISQFRPELMKPIIQSAVSAVRTLRTGRAVEGAWETAFDEIEANDKAAAEAAAQNPPPPDYEMMKLENEAQKTQTQAQVAQQDAEIKMQQAQMDMQETQFKLQAEAAQSQFDQWLEGQKLELESMKVQGDLQIKQQANEIAAQQVMSRDEIDKIAQNIEMFRVEFDKQLEQKRLELDAFTSQLEMKEKIMEENRLKSEQLFEALRIDQKEREIESAKREVEKTATKDVAPSPPVIHIHNGGGAKQIVMKRDKDGSLVGSSKSVEAEDD
jgi:hypothetical protein